MLGVGRFSSSGTARRTEKIADEILHSGRFDGVKGLGMTRGRFELPVAGPFFLRHFK